jgi:hypothetical protein
MADSSQTRHAIVDEVVVGTIPASPVFQELRVTGGGLTEKSGYTSSNEIRRDRNVSDSTLVSRDADGEFAIEFSYGSFDSLIEKFLCSTWDDDVIVNGVEHKTFAYERTDELGATDDFERFVGAMVNTFNLNIQAREQVTGSFGVIAEKMSIGTAPLAGATYLPPLETPVISASNDFGSLLINGVSAGAVQAITLTGTNNIATRPVVGELYSKGLRKGRFEFSGTMTVYFTDTQLRDLQRANNYADISLSLGGDIENKYDIVLPKVRLTGAEKNSPGNNEDIMLEIGFTAVYDATTGGSIEITRTPE